MNRSVDVLVVGAGPAGLAAAARLAAAGAGRIEVLDREGTAGGVPRHCAHPGFGADGRGRPLDGPAFARRAVRAALRAGATVRTGVSATGWSGPHTTGTPVLEVTGPAGPERIAARVVVLATGARERPRAARLVPGSRPAGVLTTGELQRTIALFGPGRERIGRRAVVVGGDPVARHAVRALRGAGVDVVAVVAEGDRVATVGAVPLLTETAVAELVGRGRLSGVVVRGRDGGERLLRCDTVVFTGDWIPDHELARAGGLPLSPGTRGPLVDAHFRTGVPGVFAAGNLLRGAEAARVAAAEGGAVADAVLDHLAGRARPLGGVPVRTAGPLRWVVPGLLGPEPVPLLVRAVRPLAGPLLTVAQDGVPLRRERLPATLVPWRSARLGPRWTEGLDPAGGPVVVGAEE